MKKNIKILVSTFLILSTVSTVSAQPEITVTSEMTTEGIRVSGQISEVNTQKQATILVGDPENILYINQLPTDTSGNFCFDFLMPEHIQPGQYPYKIGSDTGAETFSGTLTYTALPTQVVNEFINAQIEARIENYTPSIVGTLSCDEGKTVTIEIQNTTDGTTLANDTITAADGEYQMNYQLPNLIVPKTYTITLICTNAEQTLTTMSLTIDSSTLLVSFSGTVTTANNVTINAQAESTDVTFNKSTSITGTKTISATIPNLVPNISFYLNAQGAETILQTPPELSGNITIEKDSDDIFRITARANQLKNPENRIYTLTYDDTQIEVVNLFGAFPGTNLQTGQKGNVRILQHEPGTIIFKPCNISVDNTKVWSGILNIFQFRFMTENGGTTELNLTAN
ncbi:MAG: hypothetical protein E7397_07905 [Ruminococcaceae bacterium]|nr:hypothetical protein [Oscillospiraceae bacterium]